MSGIDRYRDPSDLNGAKADAEAFADWLVDDDGALPGENVERILIRPEDESNFGSSNDARPANVNVAKHQEDQLAVREKLVTDDQDALAARDASCEFSPLWSQSLTFRRVGLNIPGSQQASQSSAVLDRVRRSIPGMAPRVAFWRK